MLGATGYPIWVLPPHYRAFLGFVPADPSPRELRPARRSRHSPSVIAWLRKPSSGHGWRRPRQAKDAIPLPLDGCVPLHDQSGPFAGANAAAQTAEETTGDYSYLGWSASKPAEKSSGKLQKEISPPRRYENTSENEETNEDFSHYLCGYTQYSLCRQGKGTNQIYKGGTYTP